MSGRTLKKLRRELKHKLGRPVRGTTVVGQDKQGVAYMPSEWRRAKKMAKKGMEV